MHHLPAAAGPIAHRTRGAQDAAASPATSATRTVPAGAAPLDPSQTISAEAVASVARILPSWLAAVQQAHHLTGLQAAIWHDGQIVAEAAAGPADASAGIELTSTHRLRIASHSKTFTSIAIMALAEQGRLRLDDPASQHVPELADSPVGPLTLRDLLSHAAGLTRDSADSRWWQSQRPFADRATLIGILREGAVLAPVGQHLQYSNIGYGLLGLVIEAVTGQSFAEAVTELVLEPLGIADVGPDLPADAAGPEDPHGFAVGHSAAVLGERRIIEQMSTGALAAATGFWATAAGVAEVFGRVLCDAEVISADSVTTMRRRVWTIGEGRHYGLGLQEGTLAGFAAIGHSGGFPTGLSRTWAVPSARLAVSVIGTSVDSPASDVAVGILGLLALAAGRPAPQAAEAEAAGAGGGAGSGRPRPAPLTEQEGVTLEGRSWSAPEIAASVAGTYEDLWGRERVALLGDRLFAVDESAVNPSQGAAELRVAGTCPDPHDPALTDVVLETWGDVGYGSYLEPMLARIDAEGTCTGILSTGHMLTPTGAVELPDRCPPAR